MGKKDERGREKDSVDVQILRLKMYICEHVKIFLFIDSTLKENDPYIVGA